MATAVLTGLADQLDCYRRMATMAGEQSRAIFGGETDKLLAILEQREHLTARAAELESTLKTFKSDWPASADAMEDADRDEAKRLLGEIKRTLASLTKQDDKDAATLRARLAMTGGELEQAKVDDRHVRQINRRYAAAAYGKPKGKLDVSR